jgi:hypothetical protein
MYTTCTYTTCTLYNTHVNGIVAMIIKLENATGKSSQSISLMELYVCMYVCMHVCMGSRPLVSFMYVCMVCCYQRIACVYVICKHVFVPIHVYKIYMMYVCA